MSMGLTSWEKASGQPLCMGRIVLGREAVLVGERRAIKESWFLVGSASFAGSGDLYRRGV